MPATISDTLLEDAAAVMKAISHPIRLRVLEYLERRREANVTALCDYCDAPQPAVSQQLARMRAAGVLGTRREGNCVYYHVAWPAVLGVLKCIRNMGGKR